MTDKDSIGQSLLERYRPILFFGFPMLSVLCVFYILPRYFFLGRPTSMSADLLRFTAILSIYLSFFRPLPAELAERNSTKTGHMLGSPCSLSAI